MTTFSTILDAAKQQLSALAGDQTGTQKALMELVIALTNWASKEGSLTADNAYPKGQSYWGNWYVALREAGFEMLGAGFFSVAVSHPALPERVLKVGIKKEDSAAAYIAWCRMNQGATGVPNVYATKRSTGCYVVVLDELFPLDTEKLEEWRGFRAAASGVHGKSWYNESKQPHLDALYATAKSIREFFKGLAEFDLHDENVMVDKHGNVVITDPVSYTQGNSAGTSWCLMENAAALNEVQREALAERARIRHQRNAERQRIRKERKARLKAIRREFAIVEEHNGRIKNDAHVTLMKERGAKADVIFCDELRWKRPEGIPVAFDPALMELPKRIEWDPSEPLSAKLSRLRTELQQRVELPATVVERINGLDDSLDAQFFQG